MPRRAEFYTQLGDGPKAQSIGYSTTERDGFLGVRFIGPDGKRLEKMTACKKKDANFHIEAAKIIVKAFVKQPELFPQHVNFEDALTEVIKTSADLRPATILQFRKSIKMLRTVLNADDKLAVKPIGPSDITPELASRFGRLFLSTKYTRGSSKIERKRSPVTLSFYLRGLSSLWGQFQELGYVQSNPWANVRRPQLEKKDKYVPTEEEIEAFFAWIGAKYPTWERLDSLLKLKLLSGCRTADICQLKSDQLRNGQLVFDPSQTKTKTGRTVPLPEDLFNTLQRLAGPEWMWDGWNDDVRKFRPSKNKVPDQFQASTVYCVLANIFREYSDNHPSQPRLAPHAFRRRAITVMVTETQSVDLTAQALGVNPLTARTYYLDAQRAFNTADAFKIATEKLLPKNPPKGDRPH